MSIWRRNRTSRKKNFAFVRFKKGKGEKEMERMMQGTKCNGTVLTVNIARYERKQLPAQNVADTNNFRYVQQPSRRSLRDGRSFMEVATGRRKSDTPPPPPSALEKNPVTLVGGSSMAEWLHCPLTLVGETISFEKLRNLPLKIRLGSAHSYCMKYLGGLMVGIRFQSPFDVEEFLANKTYWGTWFKEFKAGTEVSRVFDGLAWLRIVGLPIKLFDEENFSRIVSEFGKVVVPAEILPSMQDLSLDSICILTGHKKHINEEVLVEINKRILKVG